MFSVLDITVLSRLLRSHPDSQGVPLKPRRTRVLINLQSKAARVSFIQVEQMPEHDVPSKVRMWQEGWRSGFERAASPRRNPASTVSS